MITRISSAGIHTAAVANMQKQQALLLKTQTQLASGSRLQSPADDPIAAMRVLSMEQARAGLAQFGKNADILSGRLAMGEQALADVGALLQNVRERAIQANSGAMDEGARRSIAAEIRARARELLDIANRQDGNGEYLFSGFSSQTQPFVSGAGGVSYNGDQGARSLQISPTQSVADGFPGSEVFLRIAEGNGTFTTATGVHAGTGSIDTGVVTNAAAWVPDTYTIGFTSASTWEVRDSLNNLVTSGNYTAGSAITFNGASVVVRGEPATGDSFTIEPATTKDVFATLEDLAASLESNDGTASGRSLVNTAVAAGLTQIDQALEKTLNLRAVVGVRMGTVDNAATFREQTDDQLVATIGELRDVDYAEAIARMNQQLTSLQAAQAAYSRISQLSLFDYL